ncbi:hypothetical protein BX600DRAFT_122397 [Xylariales sp. PMI_506]|nr:hypothetical protein BX600DRAFT_122397 [Xylariales sp. PMI_506]
MASSVMDLPSSPDPLADDIPSSLRPITRRMARTHLSQPPSSSLSVPNSTPARLLSAIKSPRKQTFELDVGNALSPQKLLVTVEAEDDRRISGGVTRRLFNASPTRSASRRRETMTATTTTVVPLRGLTDDEGDGPGSEATPRRRGRPLGSKNGTPNPRGKKRAGTPLRNTARSVRQRVDASSEPDLPDQASILSQQDATPKPKPRARKTPKKAGTPAAPSSKPTGRKRGRPRKALMPEEVAILTSEADDLFNDVPFYSDVPSEAGPFGSREHPDTLPRISVSQNDNQIPPTSSPGAGSTSRASREQRARERTPQAGSDREPAIEQDGQQSLDQGHQDAPVSRETEYYAEEPNSDFESEAEPIESVGYSGQDNLTHASEFSMIAVDSLPSFQASFQGNQSGLIAEEPEYADAGDETNMIINRTLESLRRSIQDDTVVTSDAPAVSERVNDATSPKVSSPVQALSSPANSDLTGKSWLRSPRRQKPLPLSRQVFESKAPHVDDSFSSIPDSVLHAATPGRLPMKSLSASVVNEDSGMYDDSFSEIPDDVLEAATPRPRARTAMLLDGGLEGEMDSDPMASDKDLPSATRSTNIGSSRLPTPDDTNSDTTGSKNASGEETQRATAETSALQNESELGFRSSPPTIGQHISAISHLEASQRRRSVTETPPRQGSPLLVEAESELSSHSQLLAPPASARRPTLSPIMRAGRTLQSLMTDRSSPEGRESSLGSPFRGSAHNDSRQSSITKSPVRNPTVATTQGNSQFFFNPIASLTQSIRMGFGSSHRQSPAPVTIQSSVPAITGSGQDEGLVQLEGHEVINAAARNGSISGADPKAASLRPAQSKTWPSEGNVTTADLPSVADDINWVGESSPTMQRVRRLSLSQQFRASNSSLVGTRGSNDNQMKEFEPAEDSDGAGPLEEQEPHHTEEVTEERYEDEGDQAMGKAVEEQEALQPTTGEKINHDSTEIYEEDRGSDIDMWDVEASRSTPRSTKALRAQAQSRRQSQAPTQVLASEPASAPSDGIPPRRGKVPSPWRRSSRRLIYQDDFRSPSEIEMEDSPPPVEAAITQPAIGESPPQVEAEIIPLQEDGTDEEDDFDIPIEDRHETFVDEIMETPQKLPPIQPQQEFLNEPKEQAPNQVDIMPPSELDEYSQMAQQNAQPEKPARKSFFGGFDIMSFFSSPAVLPKTNPQEQTPSVPKTTSRPLPQMMPKSVEKPVSDEPQSALRAIGLFPPIPQKAFNPSPKRGTDLFSPGQALHSTDTVADTFADLPSTPERGRLPSIPQKRNFTPLSAQSRNTASLFTPSKRDSTPAEEVSSDLRSVRTPSPQPEDDEEDDEPAHGFHESPQQGESPSLLTDEPSFERIPPREKPSTWDKTLSPTKSCLRSPLKPRTPGRVVEFISSVPNLDTQAQPRGDQQRVLGLSTAFSNNRGGGSGNNIFALGPALRMPPAQQPLGQEDKENTPSPPKSPERQVTQPQVSSLFQSASLGGGVHMSKPANVGATPRSSALSQTAWSKPHWIRLDELLQLRRKDPFRFQLQYPDAVYPRGSRSQQHPLQGKEVAAGEDTKMLLEAWHLEVVEAFRAEVGGWDSNALAKRLFALIIGEERRRLGLVGKKAAAGLSQRRQQQKSVRI